MEDNKPEEVVLQYLEKLAEQDSNFRAKFEDKSKNIDDCLSYIMSEARKRAKKGCLFATDEFVFCLAVHYYQEDIKVNNKPNCIVRVSEKAAVKMKPKAIELDLFGGII